MMASAHGGAGRSLLKRIGSGLSFSLGRGGSCAGLNIGFSSVKLIEVSRKKSSWVLERYGAAPTLGMLSDSRDIMNSGGVIQAIQTAARTSGITARDVCSGVAGPALMIKNLSVMVNDPSELQDQVFWEAEQYIPFDINQVVLDYSVLQKRKDSSYEVAVIAVKKTFLEQYIQVIEDSQFRPRVMDTDIFALQNVFEANYTVAPTEAVMLVDLGALSTKISVVASGRPLLVKDIPVGGMVITHEIQRDLKVTELDAESLKTSRPVPREIYEIALRSIKNIGVEIKKALDFYTASSMGPPVVGIYLAGGGAKFEPMGKMIEEITRISTQVINPFLKIEINPATVDMQMVQALGPEAAIPLGLAIRAGEAK